MPLHKAQDLPTTEELLASGGDVRIALDPLSGQNKYGCKPYPDPELLDFASSTASVISQAGYAAADRLREQLRTDENGFDLSWQHIRKELLTDVSDMGVQLVFARSGTDAHLMAAQYAAPLAVVMVEEAETGSGVTAALSASFSQPVINAVPLRLTDGMPRQIADIDADVCNFAQASIAAGGNVLLVMVDQSKTGMIAPSLACVMALHERYAGRLTVLVDACQFRIAKPTLRAYLSQGFMVAITGSKFISGPSFSAALLLPQQLEVHMESEGDLGSLLRWEAALVEFRRFRALPKSRVIHVMKAFAQAVQQRLKIDPRFEPLAVPLLDRRPLIEAQSWDHLPSIFPFLLRHKKNGLLSRDEAMRVYRQLSDLNGIARRCHLGQPVACGVCNGMSVSALRLCLSARQISDAMLPDGLNRLIGDAMVALDKTAWLVDELGDGAL